MAPWLVLIAWASVLAGALGALLIVLDIVRGHRQHMWIMNVVWPLTALYGGPLGLWAYFRLGRRTTHAQMRARQAAGAKSPAEQRPFWQTVALGTTHCGAGCSLGDILVEWFVYFVPLQLFGHALFATWTLDFIAAFGFGVGFQYFTIKPMRKLSGAQALKAAVKADSASLTAWQLGMYGWMAIVIFAGFCTSFPVNYWLITSGIKERM
jgi:Domain of unknown function (DUF4396)